MRCDFTLDRRVPFAWFVLAMTLLSFQRAEAQNWRTVTSARQVSGENSLDVEVKYAAGTFRVRPASGDVLYRMKLKYDEDNFEPVNEFRNGRLRLGIDGTGNNVKISKGEAGNLDLDLARDVPMDLNLEFGAVRAELDLGGLALTDLRVATGASETRLDVSEPNPVSLGRVRMQVGAAQFYANQLGNLNAERIELDAGVGDIQLDFTGEWQRDAIVSVDMGVGSLELTFPEGLGVKLEKDSFLTKIDAQEMVKRGDTYYSTNWDEADRKIEVEVDAAFGKISVDWVR